MSNRHERIGQQIRKIADTIEYLDPTMAPVFTGFEHAGGPGDRPRGLFQGGPVLGYDASLAHAQSLLAKVQARLLAKMQPDGTIPYPAGVVQLGWTLRIEGMNRKVIAHRVHQIRTSEGDRRVTIWFHNYRASFGDEHQMYRVLNRKELTL